MLRCSNETLANKFLYKLELFWYVCIQNRLLGINIHIEHHYEYEMVSIKFADQGAILKKIR